MKNKQWELILRYSHEFNAALQALLMANEVIERKHDFHSAVNAVCISQCSAIHSQYSLRLSTPMAAMPQELHNVLLCELD